MGENAFKHDKKKPGLSTHWFSNNWAQMYLADWSGEKGGIDFENNGWFAVTIKMQQTYAVGINYCGQFLKNHSSKVKMRERDCQQHVA